MAEETTTDVPSQAGEDLQATPNTAATSLETPEVEEVDPRILASAPINVATAEVTSTFDEWELAPELLQSLTDMGYARPMPVQEEVFKALSAGKDLMVQSKTGSGKTAAFGIPIAQRLADGKKGVQSLILAPTRELAMQVAREIEKITELMDITVVPVYGGAPINPQIKQLEAGAQIVAGTPGRVLDHIRRRTLDTSGIRMLVLDECDEMLSMGFQEEIENIISTLPEKESRQTLLFSATIPKEIERIGRRHMCEPEMVSLSSDSVGADLIDHYYYVVSGMARTRDLLKVMKSEKPESALIFCNTREETSTVARYLVRHGYDAEHLSSDLSQADRERVMARMKAKNLNFLVATDIAARGIDISALSHVINYTFPGSPEVYVHRSGRTGRAGKQGTALSLVGPREIGAFYYLKLIYKIIPAERDLPTAEEMATIEEGEQYQSVVSLVTGTPKSEYLSLAKRLWQSNEGERVVAMLLQDLITGKAEVKSKPAAPAATEPAKVARSADEAPTPRDAGRKRQRRRRGASEDEDQTSSPVEASEEAPATRPSEPEAQASEPQAQVSEAAEPSTSEAANTEESPAASSEFNEEPTSVERPKRKRRRRRSAEDKEQSAAESVEAASQDGEAEEGAQAKESSIEEDPATEDAVPESLVASEAKKEAAEEVIEEKPKRKRRRRGAKADAELAEPAEEESSEAKEEKEEKADDKPKKPREKAEGTKAKSGKRRKAKPNSSPGVHAEFWEAWAETKDSDDDATGSDDEDSGDDENEVAASEEEAAPKKKRSRRRRRGKREDEGEEESVDAEEDADSVRLFVNVGRREDAEVDEIRAFLAEAMGDKGSEIGKITLRNTHCYVRVPEAIVDEFIEACTGLSFHEREMVVERAKR